MLTATAVPVATSNRKCMRFLKTQKNKTTKKQPTHHHKNKRANMHMAFLPERAMVAALQIRNKVKNTIYCTTTAKGIRTCTQLARDC